MKLLSFMLQNARKLFFLSLVFSILGGIATTGLLISINVALNRTTHGFLVSFTVLAVAAMACRSAAGIFLARLGQNALFDLRMNLTRQILGTPLRKLEEIGPSRILAVLTEDVLNITNFLANVPVLCTNSAIAITCLVYMAWISAKLLSLVMIFMIVGIITYELLTRTANRFLTRARQDHSTVLGHFRALTAGIKELKLHRARREEFFSKVLEGTAADYRSHMLRALNIYTAAMSWGELLMFLAIGFVIVTASVMQGVSGPVIVTFVIAMLYLVGPLETIMNSLPQIGRATVALKTVEAMELSLLSRHGYEENGVQPPSNGAVQSIELRNVSFGYGFDEEKRFVLGPLNIRFAPGEIVFVTGGNGSGKSTLAKILAGLYTPDDGQILLNGRRISEAVLDHYRQNFSTVLSDFHLFDSLLGLPKTGLDESARQYLWQMQLNESVAVKNGRFSTTDLSQGQRKRLALLTAYLENRPVYIFDEWAADQDPYFRDVFYMQILPELRDNGKLVVVISHDDRYFHVADRLVKLEYGQIVADQTLLSSEQAKP